MLRNVKLKKKDTNIKAIIVFPYRRWEAIKKHKAVWTKIEDLKNIELNALSTLDDRYIRTKIRISGNKVYTNFRVLNVLENDAEYESFTVTSIDSLLVQEKKYYLKVYLDNCVSKIVKKRIADYLDESFFWRLDFKYAVLR